MAFETLAQRFEKNSKDIYNRVLSDTVYSEGGATSYTGRPINSSQPFLIILPDTGSGPLSSRSRVKDDTRVLPIVSTARDVVRLTQFVKSDAGKLFLAKQALLQIYNPYTRTRLFNPAGLLASATTAGNYTRHVTQTFLRGINRARSLLNIPAAADLIGDSPLESGIYSANGYFKPRNGNTATQLLNSAIQKLKEEINPLLPITKKTRNISDPFNNLPPGFIKDNGSVVVYRFLERPNESIVPQRLLPGELPPKKIDIITFKFSPVGPTFEENAAVPFRAFISSIKENVKPEFSEQKYIGRTERFVTYMGAKRNVQLQFNVVAFTKDELDHTWTRINYLTGLAFPKGISTSGFMVPPLFRITIGQIYDNQPCYIETLDYDFLDDSITFDIDKEVSQVINVSMTLSILEKSSRYYNSPFYEITKRMAETKQNLGIPGQSN